MPPGHHTLLDSSGHQGLRLWHFISSWPSSSSSKSPDLAANRDALAFLGDQRERVSMNAHQALPIIAWLANGRRLFFQQLLPHRRRRLSPQVAAENEIGGVASGTASGS